MGIIYNLSFGHRSQTVLNGPHRTTIQYFRPFYIVIHNGLDQFGPITKVNSHLINFFLVYFLKFCPTWFIYIVNKSA